MLLPTKGKIGLIVNEGKGNRELLMLSVKRPLAFSARVKCSSLLLLDNNAFILEKEAFSCNFHMFHCIQSSSR